MTPGHRDSGGHAGGTGSHLGMEGAGDMEHPQGNGAEPGGAGWGLEPLGQGKVSLEGVTEESGTLKSLPTQTTPGPQLRYL